MVEKRGKRLIDYVNRFEALRRQCIAIHPKGQAWISLI